MERYRSAVANAGLETFVDGRHLRVTHGGRQIAVMRVSTVGDFEWGWVEHPDGRSDHWGWAAWWRELQVAKAWIEKEMVR